MIYQGRMLHGETEATSSVLRSLSPAIPAPDYGPAPRHCAGSLDQPAISAWTTTAAAEAEADSTVFRAYSGGDSHMSVRRVRSSGCAQMEWMPRLTCMWITGCPARGTIRYSDPNKRLEMKVGEIQVMRGEHFTC